MRQVNLWASFIHIGRDCKLDAEALSVSVRNR
jgi:hypothetical protein